ncbi:MAG: nuclear transport factor 2 family protein [Phenylobacterium sp.]
MTPTEMETLAKGFFDAVERGDIEHVYGSYAPGAAIWHNTDGLEQSPEDNAETLKGMVLRIPKRTYSQRRVNVFPGGFVQQHVLLGVRKDGVTVELPCCIVCQVKDGKITRLDEYFDSEHVAQFRKAV